MPRKGTRHTEPSSERSRPNRPKLDARLEFLLSLPSDRLTALRQEEGRRLQEIAREIGAARAAIDAEETESGKSRTRERLRVAEASVFAPLSTGLHAPADPKGGARPPANITEPFISAFILSDASAADLADLRVQVRSRVGDVFTAFIPVSAIPNLEASASVRYIELERPVFPALQSALTATQIGQLHNPPPGVASHKGAGVIVGVVDLEILDIYHPGFRTEADTTRVLYLWDQRLTPQNTPLGMEAPPGGPGFSSPLGVEYDQAAINAELTRPAAAPVYQRVRHADVPNNAESHGTFVAGIAAGNGREPGQVPTSVGAAPAADIIYVRAELPASTELFVGAELFTGTTYIADAFAYIFDRAGHLGRPCVVNMSASDDQGPHDGDTAGEQFIDGLLLTPGRAVTVSAGNANKTESHASGSVGQGATEHLQLTYANGATSSDVIEIWYDGHDRFTVTVTLPTGVVIPNVAPNASTDHTLPNGVEVTVRSILDSPLNHDNVISVIIAVNGQQVPLGDWTFSLTGTQVINGAFHAWVDRNNRNQSAWKLPPTAGAPGRHEDHFTLSVPATGRRVIAVGNHAEPPPPPAPQHRAIDNGSGRGPTRDGRIKPEIAAVGTAIRAPRSRDMRLPNPGAFYMTKHPATSWSAPLVAGACALLFECRGPSATWANLKQILTGTAGTTGVAVPGDDFGFGYLQVGSACTGSLPAVDTWLRDDVTDTGIEPFTGPVAWMSPDIEVLDTAGNPVANPSYHPTNRYNNIVQVTVRNRGSQPARNTAVFLYWADPATNIPYSAWDWTRFYTGPPNFVTQGNAQVIPLLPPGGSTQVRFAWAPPAPGSNLRQDNHFCLLARVENEGDLSQAGAGGWSVIAARNNIALRNVLVQASPTTMGFWTVGSADQDTLIIRPQAAEIELLIPIEALPWRDRRLIERHGPRAPYGVRAHDPLRTLKTVLKAHDAEERTDVFGATTLELYDGVARIRAGGERGVILRSLRLLEGARMPVRLHVRAAATDAGPRFVHVAQYSGGQLIGGVSLQFGRTA